MSVQQSGTQLGCSICSTRPALHLGAGAHEVTGRAMLHTCQRLTLFVTVSTRDLKIKYGTI